jgi:hypothetical protein
MAASVYIFRIDYYAYKRDITGAMCRLGDHLSSTIIAFSSDEAIRTVKLEGLKENYIIEPYSVNMICEIDKFSAPLVQRIVNDMSAGILKAQEKEKEQSEYDSGNLSKTVWRNSSL